MSKVEEPEEEEEKRSEEKIRFLGYPRPTARLHPQVLVVLWKKRSDLAEQQQRWQQQREAYNLNGAIAIVYNSRQPTKP